MSQHDVASMGAIAATPALPPISVASSSDPSGALRVYESMGFVPISRETTYRKSI